MTRSRHSLPIVMLLVAATLAMRALVPQGWMPDATGEGVFAVKPCAMQWPMSEPVMAMDAHSGHGGMAGEGDHSEHLAAEPCAMAGFALAALSGGDFAILATPPTGQAEYDIASSQAVNLARRRTLPPARAPPLTA